MSRLAGAVVIPSQRGASFELLKGQLLRVIDPEGEQVSDLFCFSKSDLKESLSAGRSIDYADKIFLSTGDRLYSNRSEVMLEIVADTCGTHDFLMTPCSLKMFQIVAQNDLYHPSCHENLYKALEHFGVNPDMISTTFNIFMNVPVSADGSLRIETPRSRPGAEIIFRAHMDLIVGLTACSHEETNNGRCKPIHFEIL